MIQLDGETAFGLAAAAGVPIETCHVRDGDGWKLTLRTAVPCAVLLDGGVVRVFTGLDNEPSQWRKLELPVSR